MNRTTNGLCRWIVTASLGLWVTPAFGQTGPWDVFLDDQSESECGIIKAENAELVMLSDTRELVVVTVSPRPFPGSFVNSNGDVFIDEEPVGLITYATDGDGTRTVWWLTVTGRVVHLDDLTLEPSVSEQVPADFIDVPCDACEFWPVAEACAPPPPPPPPVLTLCGAGLGPATLIGSLIGVSGLCFYRLRQR